MSNILLGADTNGQRSKESWWDTNELLEGKCRMERVDSLQFNLLLNSGTFPNSSRFLLNEFHKKFPEKQGKISKKISVVKHTRKRT